MSAGPGHRSARPAQRGVATLTVVMVLFFIVSLVAAYTSRNLIFEQRTSANLYRSTQAFEAAEAGIEWAITQLNGGRVDAQCRPPPDADETNDTFRDRYLTFDTSTGNITAKVRAGGGWPTCAFDGSSLKCICPDSTDPALTPPTGAGPFPAFRVRMVTVPGRPGVVLLEANGCTSLGSGATCLAFPARAASGEGLATVSVIVALKSALTTPPAAPLTARGAITGSTPLRVAVTNVEASVGGITLHAGGTVPYEDADFVLTTLAGTPTGGVVDGDIALFMARSNDSDEIEFANRRMFASVLGMWPSSFKDQSTVLPCKTVLDTCTASDITELLRLNPGRTVFVPGNLRIDAPLGTATAPVMVVVDGTITISDMADTIHGLVYSQSGSLTVARGVQWYGAIVGETDLSIDTSALSGVGADKLAIEYDLAVLKRLRWGHGSFVRVPGTWRDFQ